MTTTQWIQPDYNDSDFEFSYGNSLLLEFVKSHSPSDVLRELVQNEYDAGGAKLEMTFGSDTLTVTGNGRPIDSAGWKRLSVVLGTGSVGSDRNIPQKRNGIGSKNFGLRTLFAFGDQIHISSDGSYTVLDASMGAFKRPKKNSDSSHRTGVVIRVPFRDSSSDELQAFDYEREAQVFEGLASNLTSTVIKLAQPGSAKNLGTVGVSSYRLDRRITWKQSTLELPSNTKGVSVLQRSVRITENPQANGSSTATKTLKEIEFQKDINLPEQFRGQSIPDYFRASRERIRIAVSMRLYRGKIDLKEPGTFYYPIGIHQGYTGSSISVCAPFQLDNNRSHLVDSTNSPLNRWLLRTAADFTLELLSSDWFERYGADAYLALRKLITPSESGYLERIESALAEEEYWPTKLKKTRRSERPRLVKAHQLSIPDYPVLNKFISDQNKLEPGLYADQEAVLLALKSGAEKYGINSLVWQRCGLEDPTNLQTELKAGEANHDPYSLQNLKSVSLQGDLAGALENHSRRLTSANRKDLSNSPTTLAADGNLAAPASLYLVDPSISDVCPIPTTQQLHPSLLNYKVITRLCKSYDTSTWASEVAERSRDGTAGHVERTALYNFILSSPKNFNRRTRSILRNSPVLLDHRANWVSPALFISRSVPNSKLLEPVLHFPHRRFAKDSNLARSFQFRRAINSDDIVKFAKLVEEKPDLAGQFESILSRFVGLLGSGAIKRLAQLRFLRSSEGGVEKPDDLYIRNSLTQACLGERAPYATNSNQDLLSLLGCRSYPRSGDIYLNLSDLADNDAEPERPDVLYPALVKALEEEGKPADWYRDEPLIRFDGEYFMPNDLLLGSSHRDVFLESSPIFARLSGGLRKAFLALGAHSQPQTHHWKRLLLWICDRNQENDNPISVQEKYSLLEAYANLDEISDEISDEKKCLLDRTGRLNSINAAQSARFLYDDDPSMSRAIEDQNLPISFAEDSKFSSRKFFFSADVSRLSQVARSIRSHVQGERTSPSWFSNIDILEKIKSDDFLLAIRIAEHEVLDGNSQLSLEDSDVKNQIQNWRIIRFADELIVDYQVGDFEVSVPAKLVSEEDQLIFAGVKRRSEFYDALAAEIAGLISQDLHARRTLTDIMFRLLNCNSSREMKAYLESRGISWPASLEIEDNEDDERSEEEDLGQDDIDGVQELLSDMLSKQLANEDKNQTSENREPPSRIAVPPNPRPSQSPDVNVLPQFDDVQLVIGTQTGSWKPTIRPNSPQTHNSNWEPRTRVEQDRDEELGRRGEELIFRQEQQRVREFGYSDSRVIWTSDNDQGADHDIQSVDKDGNTIWIEVKSSAGTHGRFLWSKAEFEKALRKRERYVLWRVYDASTKHPVAVPFRDPIGLLINETMRLDISSLNAEVEPLMK